MSRLILTMAVGTEYQAMARLTHPSIRAYAERIGADFHCIEKQEISQTTVHWEKFQIYDLLENYDRILYMDTDVIVRDDTPDLFEVVPEKELGMFMEAPFVERSKELMIDICRAYGVTLPFWNGKYYNSGIMVVSQAHRALFKKPEQEAFSFWEQ